LIKQASLNPLRVSGAFDLMRLAHRRNALTLSRIHAERDLAHFARGACSLEELKSKMYRTFRTDL
jgi:hypothetical protein